MLINRSQLKFHAIVGLPVLAASVLCLGLYVRDSLHAGEWVGGASRSGLLCGVAAGMIILFEMLLWPRKFLRAWRLIPAKFWMSAHIWLGIVSLPLAIAHCGFHLGGALPTALIVLFVLTCLSGFYGLVVQNILPKWMLRNLPAETIYSQTELVAQQAVDDLEQMILVACGRRADSTGSLAPELAEPTNVVVGSLREQGRIRGRTLQTVQVAGATKDNTTLWGAFDEIKSFLLDGKTADTPVNERQEGSSWFAKLRSKCGTQSAVIIDAMESTCDQRRQFDTQRRVHRWLHAWLPIHIGLSIAVTLLLAAHVWTALKYW